MKARTAKTLRIITEACPFNPEMMCNRPRDENCSGCKHFDKALEMARDEKEIGDERTISSSTRATN